MFFGVFIVNTPHSLMHVASGAMFLIASIFGSTSRPLCGSKSLELCTRSWPQWAS